MRKLPATTNAFVGLLLLGWVLAAERYCSLAAYHPSPVKYPYYEASRMSDDVNELEESRGCNGGVIVECH